MGQLVAELVAEIVVAATPVGLAATVGMAAGLAQVVAELAVHQLLGIPLLYLVLMVPYFLLHFLLFIVYGYYTTVGVSADEGVELGFRRVAD